MNNKILDFIKENKDLINSNQFEELYDRLDEYDRNELSNVFITAGIDFLSYMEEIPDSCFYKSSLNTITIPNCITSIGSLAFARCKRLTRVTIPDSVTSIDDRAFVRCTSLTSVTIGNSVKSIGDWVFYGCTELTSITIPDSVKSIGESTFCGCSNLTSVTIGNSITSISGCMFEDCKKLTSITIPNSVTSIGHSAFNDCNNLEKILFNGTKDEWNSIQKYTDWNRNTGDYKIQCIDGEIYYERSC